MQLPGEKFLLGFICILAIISTSIALFDISYRQNMEVVVTEKCIFDDTLLIKTHNETFLIANDWWLLNNGVILWKRFEVGKRYDVVDTTSLPHTIVNINKEKLSFCIPECASCKGGY
jgi:hypothetical protein